MHKGRNAELVTGSEAVECLGKGKSVGFEVVLVGERDKVGWMESVSGLHFVAVHICSNTVFHLTCLILPLQDIWRGIERWGLSGGEKIGGKKA